MKLNEDTALLSPKILLVPYDPHHVPTYHQWMEDTALRDATASEGLSIEEEYNMQRGWRLDPDKLTFISVIPPAIENETDKASIIAGSDDAASRMIGDVNLFFQEDDDDEDDESDEGMEDGDDNSALSTDLEGPRKIAGEVEVMIARSEYRGRGLGKATLLLFLAYVLRNREEVVAGLCKDGETATLSTLKVKINRNNHQSIGLFENVGFRKKTPGTTNYFGEYEMCVEMPLEQFQVHIDGLLEEYGMGNWRELQYDRSLPNGH
ncbi:hypothetical protein L211DRAFT_855055 [Terfezia boudieri ATCC MYA-4762]|uniref:N-acetyltransferase domain-containing protein n=1 Tax=Terfezia boudieri ATCC MYA-4762 TaxID=1051890 RepID=A0A3N4M1B6_9PEZI|nr:hypothetical protein L211DRAFT_855055 [Terfezia boudieri ATCC MYA-4762]